ncbi:MAG: amidohydrolase family protein, partial [Thermacetogeniaceae bacterium]
MWDLLIEGGYVLTMEGPGVGFLQDAAIGVRNGVIGYVGPKSELPSRQCHKYIDATGHVVMPGLINAHAHTGSCIIRGVGQDIYNWMQRGIWPFSQHMTRDDAVVGSLLNIVEAVLVGTTCFCDFADRMSELLPNYVMVGARARVAHTINEMPTDSAKFQVGELYRFDPAVGQRKLQDSIKMLEEWHGRENGRITCLVGPQGPDMMSLELLMECREVAKRYDTMIHMHVAQGDREINQMLKRYGKRSIQFLDELGYLDDRLMAVHLTEATPEETKIVAERGASMILCSASIAVIDG